MDKVTPYLKAYAALIGSVCTALLGIYGPDTEVGHWLTVAVAVATALTTFYVPNLDPKAQHQDESVQPPYRGERGESALTIALVVLIVVVVLILLVPGLR